jgi:hypothetical protein
MELKGLATALGPGCEVAEETTPAGRSVVRARGRHPGSGLNVTLVFPLDGSADLTAFKERLVRVTLNRGSGR